MNLQTAIRLALCGAATAASALAADSTTLAPVTISADKSRISSEETRDYTVPTMASATGMALSAQETPQTVSVITQQQLRDQNIRDLAGALNSTPGISVSKFDRGRNTFSARGFTIDKYQIDGMNVNWAGAWVAGESVIDTSLYDRVEIVRGATGLMTGAGNPSASVNLVRKHADSSERKTALEAGVGRYGDLKLSADHSQPLTASGNLRGRLIANYQGGKTFVDREKDKSTTLYGVLDADITPTTSASLGISHQRNDKDGAMWGGLPVTYTDGSFTNWKRGKSDSTNWSYWDSRTTNLFIEGKQALNDNWNVSLKADHRNATGDSELFYFSGGSVNRNGLDWTPWPGKFHTDAKQNTIQLQTDGKIQAWGQEHDLIAGIQYNRHHRSSYSWDKGDIAPASDFNTWNGNYPRPNWGARSLSHDQTDTETALYAATRLRITDQLSTIIGTRVSNWKSTGESYTKPFIQKNSAIWTPYAGITYDITPNQTVYASYADIYKPQTERDRNNNLLDPIRGSTYELGWKANWLDGRLNTQASAYRTRQDNLAQSSNETIAGTNPPATAYYAAKGAKISGFELEASGNIGENLRLGAGYSQWTGKDAKGKALNTTHPRRQLKLFAAYDVPAVSGLTVGGGVAWQSRTWTETKNPTTGANMDYGQNSYTVVNLMSRYQINEHLSAQINIDNLFDKKYRNQLSFNQYGYGDPRYISASFKYEF